MQDLTYTYHTPTEDITITGFIAYLLQQGDAWDIRCLEADARDYHAQQYARMHPTVALQQELQWWLDVVDNERLDTLPNRDELLESGLTYLQWRVHEQITPLSDSEMLNTDMTIRVDEHHAIYKQDESLGVFEHSTESPLFVIHGFPAQLLTYAACITMDAYIRHLDIADPIAWVDSMIGWLESPSAIMLAHIQFAIPDEMLGKSPFDLSGGEKRRVAIAGILASNPDILILDEPTVGLDPSSKKELLELLKQIHEDTDKTIIIVTHDMNLVANYSKRTIVLDEGQIVFDDKTRKLFNNYQQLKSLNLDLPYISKLALELKDKGIINFDELPITLDELYILLISEFLIASLISCARFLAALFWIPDSTSLRAFRSSIFCGRY